MGDKQREATDEGGGVSGTCHVSCLRESTGPGRADGGTELHPGTKW